ncbi:MAG: sulfotransferase [Afipia sp.]|jgi:tetratricopeptide (TPR) repeat protein|uniref:tetratricopeptide repeat-containing sulfotransferase family protein n=1 Tax=Novosphingobium sp. B-7 TaxID=1298855 RepID=UPI0003B35FA9|nr:sulfotransferase [Novosphingobium sp. B-7]MBP9233233.1 sulfotransferase [Hyphomonadaceae bacterium]MCI1272761.1 sulfotransferase [Sphingobium sp.]TXJ08368.1 MAG: sulfotransferase [Afipia sp.]
MTSVGGHPRQAELEATLTAHLDQARARRCASKEHAIAVQTLCALGRHGEAAALLDRLAAMPAGTAEDDEALGFAAFAAGAHQLSRDCYARVVDARPDDPLAWYNLAAGERTIGQLEAAEAACDQALRLSPGAYEAALLRSVLRTQTVDRNHVEALQGMLERAPAPPAIISLHYALGKEYEDLGDYDAAFHHFSCGATVRRQTLSYEVADDVAKLRRIIESFDAGRLALAPGLTPPAYGFIVGLPRSGTTMIERILTGSPRARSNGETDNLLGALGEGAAATGADVFERVAGANGARVLAGYARRAGSPAAGDIILEKLPFNYLYAGAVRLTLPCARTLLVNRAPADNLFAMYSTLFGSAYPFSYSFGDLAAYYFAYSELLDHWRKVLGPQLLEVAYENVVSEPERNGRKIAGHMGIAWDDAMVRIERNKTASATASAAQIRRPIYRTAAGRWRNYERHLRPLLDLLEAGGIDPFRARNGPEER